jgi:hypothetical protein
MLRQRLSEINDQIAELADVRDELQKLLETHPPGTCPEKSDIWWCKEEFAERR